MPSAITRTKPNRRSRRLSGQQRPQMNPVPAEFVSASKSGAIVTIVFDQAVVLSGLPQYTTSVSGLSAISAAMTSPTTVAVTFSGAVTAATTVTIPSGDAAVRTATGGYANAGTFPVT